MLTEVSGSDLAPSAATCCVVGGGPAGMMLGLLLARAGITVVVLEKHTDFLRDFRGDTLHPSTLELMHELGYLPDLLDLPHQEIRTLRGQIGDGVFAIADFSHLPTHCKFLAIMPQWDFLNFLARQAARYPTFRLEMQAEATELIEESGRVVGIRAQTPSGPIAVRAELVVGADGRHSVVRDRAGLRSAELGAPMDVLWFRLSRRPTDPDETMGRFDLGRVFVVINRGEHWQCGFVIPKGTVEQIHQRGLDAFRREVAALAPFAGDRTAEIHDWADVKLLTVRVDRLTEWCRPGLLCIGDAAHAMSPVGGVGINLAIQDAVAAANLLAEPLQLGQLTREHLRRVQRRREWPTRWTQRLQLVIQNRVITRVLAGGRPLHAPWPVRLLDRFPRLRRLPARVLGIGFRPEHVRTPAVGRAPS
jgi:2-polyprenyl-6-methoxyphenol hydroxylase-like FAD-dependent oxidoreductase